MLLNAWMKQEITKEELDKKNPLLRFLGIATAACV